MERNDISNEVARKLVFVFDGFVGKIPEEGTRAAERARRSHRWSKLARLYEVDTQVTTHLWDIVWRSPYSFDLVSFEGISESWFEALTERLERANVPYSRLDVFNSIEDYSQQLAFMPYVMRVYHNNPEWIFTFGNRGEYVSDAAVFELR